VLAGPHLLDARHLAVADEPAEANRDRLAEQVAQLGGAADR